MEPAIYNVIASGISPGHSPRMVKRRYRMAIVGGFHKTEIGHILAAGLPNGMRIVTVEAEPLQEPTAVILSVTEAA